MFTLFVVNMTPFKHSYCLPLEGRMMLRKNFPFLIFSTCSHVRLFQLKEEIFKVVKLSWT